MSRTRLPRRLEATEDDLTRARDAAHAIAATILGRDPGPMTIAASMSHYVYIGADVVVKLVDVDGHHRLDLEITLAPHLPTGLSAPLLASGRRQGETSDIRYACFTRMSGTAPGIGLPGVEAKTARQWAEQAVQRLNDLHNWQPAGRPEQALRESPVHEGFVSRAALIAEIERIIVADHDAVIPSQLIEGLAVIAEHAPQYTRSDTPVHADCDWGNWLADDHGISALLDFERARFGEAPDDWVLLAATSGPHLATVLDVIAQATATVPETLRAECEVRDATFIAEDIRFALQQPEVPQWIVRRVGDLERLVVGRRWWQDTR